MNKPQKYEIELVDPVEYTVIMPTILVGAQTSSKLTLTGKKVFAEVYAFNHKEEPNKLTYFISYANISGGKEQSIKKNAKKMYMDLQEDLTKLFVKIDKKVLQTILGPSAMDTSMYLISEISYDDKKHGFHITLAPTFKKLLCKENVPYTKGDILFLRKIENLYSFDMYWLIRKEQYKTNINQIICTFEELKSRLNIEGYEMTEGNEVDVWKNFKRRVLNKIKAEFESTWVEFNYTKKGDFITIKFKNDEEIRDSLLSDIDYPWELDLEKFNMKSEYVTFIKSMVESRKVVKGLTVDSDYVISCISMFIEKARKLRKKGRDLTKDEVPRYLFEAIVKGYYVEEILKNEEKTSKTPEPTRREKIPLEEVTNAYNSYVKKEKEMGNDVYSIEEYTIHFGYTIEGDFVYDIRGWELLNEKELKELKKQHKNYCEVLTPIDFAAFVKQDENLKVLGEKVFKKNKQ